MKSDKRVGKRVVLGIFILGIVLISVVSISAGWTDIFKFGSDNKDLEGELNEQAVATVKVSDTVSPPIILFVSDVTSAPTLGGSANLVKLVPKGQNTIVSFSFVAQQGGAEGNLPTATFSGAAFNRSGVTPIETIRSTSCLGSTLNNCPLSICGNTNSARNYSCSVTMIYYDGNGTWSINTTVTSATGTGINFTKTFTVDKTFAAYAHTTYLNWTSSALNSLSTNKGSNNPIMIENNGNVPYPNVVINASDLNGTGQGQEKYIIPANKFNANGGAGAGICNAASATALSNNFNVPVSQFTATRAIYTDNGGKNTSMPFCITALNGLNPLLAPPGLPTQEYKSYRSWILTLA